MVDLNSVHHNIKEVLKAEVDVFLDRSRNGTLKDYDIKSLETLAKIAAICKAWDATNPTKSSFDNLSVEELSSQFGADNELSDEESNIFPSSQRQRNND